ncbi:MAG: pilus assembly protein PilM [Ardenticatenaceae bacterium]|nr:pilus assembly protein PilM [Ardenticatenaceae bacterium]
MSRLSDLLKPERVTLLLEEETARLLAVREEHVVRWGSAPIPRGAIADGRVRDIEAVAGAVQRLWDVHQPPREGVIVGVPGVAVTTRVLSVAGAGVPGDEEVRAAAAQNLDLDEVYLAWQLVGPPSQRVVYVLAMPRSVLDAYLAVLDLAAVAPAAIDLKQLALIRAVGHRHTIVVDLERAVLSVVVVDEALPRLVRVWPLHAPLLARPDDKVTRAAEALGLAIADYNREPSGSYLHPAVPIHLTGALSDQVLLREVVQVALGHPAVLAPAPFETPPDLPVTHYLANMGLALKQL